MFGRDVYSCPEMFGLDVLDVLHEEDLSYEFNMLAVWVHKDGRVFYAMDSGCSCPSPFEDYLSLDSLSEVTNENLREFEEDVRAFPVNAAEQEDLIRSVWKRLPR